MPAASIATIGIAREESLAALFGLPIADLHGVFDDTTRFITRYLLIDPIAPDKAREVLSVRGLLRRCQSVLLDYLVSRCFTLNEHSHGGVRGRSIRTNARSHVGSSWLFTTDVSHFFPSIHQSRVYRFFVDQGCTPGAARILTQVCTHDHHLAVGLITSPALADQLFRPIDQRLAGLAKEAGLVYTRFVDDITFSGDFDFSQSGIPDLVTRVVREHGFTIQQKKHQMGRTSGSDMAVTQLRLRKGNIDVRKDYLAKLVATIEQLKGLQAGEEFGGDYVTRSQLEGRVRFVCSINPRHRTRLFKLLRRLDWNLLDAQAEARGLVSRRPFLVKQGAT